MRRPRFFSGSSLAATAAVASPAVAQAGTSEVLTAPSTRRSRTRGSAGSRSASTPRASSPTTYSSTAKATSSGSCRRCPARHLHRQERQVGRRPVCATVHRDRRNHRRGGWDDHLRHQLQGSAGEDQYAAGTGDRPRRRTGHVRQHLRSGDRGFRSRKMFSSTEVHTPILDSDFELFCEVIIAALVLSRPHGDGGVCSSAGSAMLTPTTSATSSWLRLVRRLRLIFLVSLGTLRKGSKCPLPVCLTTPAGRAGGGASTTTASWVRSGGASQGLRVSLVAGGCRSAGEVVGDEDGVAADAVDEV